ncbi:methyltransferase [Acidobacteria bacterium Mor1]|nr:methyltransferase [Acidobacteria bacterium Mor1]
MSTESLDVERAVRDRYSEAAQAREAALCCPVEYDTRYLEIIPQEIIERDYGCGDPTRWIKAGETVLDLGSGGGKACYIASQVVGASGKVIGVDMNDEMLGLARKHRQAIGETLGYHNVEFHKGRIQDLGLDLGKVEARLAEKPIGSLGDWEALETWQEELRRSEPMIADDSVDVIVSNCVLNLVKPEAKEKLFGEMHRVLKRGGRVVISDIVCDEEVPRHMQDDPELWSGCISGAYREDKFLEAFERAGFYGIQIVKRDANPWQVVQGIEFRSVTVEAYKGKEGACYERNQAVLYKGPWSSVTDDDGHTLYRGQPMAVCDKTFQIYTREPYASHVEAIEPRVEIPLEGAALFDCSQDVRRDPRVTKGADYSESRAAGEDCCSPSESAAPSSGGCC